MKKKILVLSLALALAIPAFSSAKNANKKERANTNNANNALFSISSVSPTTIENYAGTDITITGAGFSSISIVGVKLGTWEDNTKDTTDDSVLLSNISVVDDATITATIPAGTHAQNNQDLTVFDTGVSPSAHYTLADAITIHPSFQVNDLDGDNDGIVEVFKSNLSSAKATFKLTVLGKSFKNKRWLKLKVGAKKAVITKVSRVGTTSEISAKFRYGKMAVSTSNIILTYKDRMKYGVVRKNKVKYRNSWEKGTMGVGDAFSVKLSPIQ